MLNEWVFDARLVKQDVTRFSILFHIDTTVIDSDIVIEICKHVYE